MRNNNNRIILLQLQRQILNLHRRNRIERTRRLIHQDNLRLHSQRSCDTQALLLTTAEAQRTFIQPILQLIPDSCLTQTALHNLVQLALLRHAMDTRSIGHIIINALGERIRLLKNHAHAVTQADRINIRKDILAIQTNFALDAHALN